MQVMKKQIRILAIDDSEFTFKNKTVPIIGVLARIPSYIESVLKNQIYVDGRDANEIIISMVQESRYYEQIRLILIDGVTLGGFNIVDISDLYKKLNIPIATITRKKPDLVTIKDALISHFPDWEERYKIISRGIIEDLQIDNYKIYTRYEGIKRNDLISILKTSTLSGAIPEPLRIAHLIATALARGESRGRV